MFHEIFFKNKYRKVHLYNLALAILILLGAYIYKKGSESMKWAYLIYHTGGNTRLSFSWGADI
jgi:hypothetical protein|tara:strand:- start:176 stop:364 length:189 start_codon:yes stop_codon:yes gene_type:complete